MLELILTVILDPRIASFVGATLAGYPAFGPQLLAICEREGPGGCERIGVHLGDAGASRSVWRNAARVGLLDPDCQPDAPATWSTRGSYGTMAGYTLHHLPGRCWPAWVLDVPLVAAFASTRRAHHPACYRAPACMAWRGQPPEEPTDGR